MTVGRLTFSKATFAPLVAGAVGLALAVGLLRTYGARSILELIRDAGWVGIASLVGFHGIQMLCSALGWRAIAERAPATGSLPTYFVVRWIREAVNNLLPLAQIGGEVVAPRLLRQRGTQLPIAIAGTVADLTMEMVTQIIFTLVGVALLLLTGEDGGLARAMFVAMALALLVMTSLFVALRFGLGRLIESGLLRLGALLRWQGATHVEGISAALMACYQEPSRVARSAFWHLVSWLLGGVEVCLALHFLGHDVGAQTGLVIESLGQAAKALGFAVPGALGIQEAGYAMVGAVFGLPANLGIALSLIKRLREVILGVPALVIWQRWEAKVRLAPRLLSTETGS